MAGGRGEIQTGRRRSSSGGSRRAARPTSSARHRCVRRRLPCAESRGGLLGPATSGSSADRVRRQLSPSGFQRDAERGSRDPSSPGLRDRDVCCSVWYHQARDDQRPRGQRAGVAPRCADDQSRRPHLHLRRHRRDQRHGRPRAARRAERRACRRDRDQHDACGTAPSGGHGPRTPHGAQVLQPLPRLHLQAQRRLVRLYQEDLEEWRHGRCDQGDRRER